MKHKKAAITSASVLFAAILVIAAALICTVRRIDFEYQYFTADTQAEIISAKNSLNELMGGSIFAARADDIAEGLEKNPYIIVKSVKIRLPHAIFVKVEERREKYCLEISGEYYVISDDGIVLDKRTSASARADGIDLVRITGDLQAPDVGSTISADSLLTAANALYDAFGDPRNEIEEINIDKYNDASDTPLNEWNRIVLKTREGAVFTISEADYLSKQKAELTAKAFAQIAGEDRVTGKFIVFTAENDTVDWERNID